MSKTVKSKSNYQKATERMNMETARAIANVKHLEELYKAVQKQRRELMTKNV